MKKLIGILLMLAMIGLPLDAAFARGGGGDGAGRGGGGDRAGRGRVSDRRKRTRDAKSDARQVLRDRDEDKDTCRDNNLR